MSSSNILSQECITLGMETLDDVKHSISEQQYILIANAIRDGHKSNATLIQLQTENPVISNIRENSLLRVIAIRITTIMIFFNLFVTTIFSGLLGMNYSNDTKLELCLILYYIVTTACTCGFIYIKSQFNLNYN